MARASGCFHWVILILVAGGCRLSSPEPVSLPTRHAVHSEQFLVRSDFRLSREHPLVQELISLREQIAETLALPVEREQVVMYLFDNELEYRQYLKATYPRLPPRRAYFVGTEEELSVYTFWGERIQEDLRHEFTHGLLHASLDHVPLWLDEGLAEYFETPGAVPHRVNQDYAQRLQTAMENGWEPDLQRLEAMDEFAEMQRLDYQEAWGWVHVLLHSDRKTKQTFLAYLSELQHAGDPRPLSRRLADETSTLADRFAAHIDLLASGGMAESRELRAES